MRVALKTAPLEQWAVAREMRQRIKARFDLEGIEIPYAQRVLWIREQERPDPTVTDEEAHPPARGPAQTEAEVSPTGETPT